MRAAQRRPALCGARARRQRCGLIPQVCCADGCWARARGGREDWFGGGMGWDERLWFCGRLVGEGELDCDGEVLRELILSGQGITCVE